MKKTIGYLCLLLALLMLCTACLTGCGSLFRKNFSDTVDLIKYVKERTVMLEVEFSDGSAAKGSGFFIDEDGTIVTCYHVIDGATEINVVTAGDGKHTASRVVDFSESNDLAIIKIDTEDKTPYLKLYKDGVDTGEDVYAIGSPSAYDSIATRGIVSSPHHVEGNVRCIVSDAYIAGGNSGGPLVNAHGEVVGVNSRAWSDSEGLGIAVDIINIDDFTEHKNWKISEYKEWYAKEVQRSYRIYDQYSGAFKSSTIHTYQEVVEDEECLYSSNELTMLGAIEGYKKDYLYYVYAYSSADFDVYTSYLTNKGFELGDAEDSIGESIDINAYRYHNAFTHQTVVMYIANNEYIYVMSYIEYER